MTVDLIARYATRNPTLRNIHLWLALTLVWVILLGTETTIHNRIFTLDEVMTAYAEGRYRTFSTAGDWLVLSADAAHSIANRDGIYRLSDGTKIADIENIAAFSPDGRYVAIREDGVYQLPEFNKVFDVNFEPIELWWGGREHRTYAIRGDITFSPDSAYVGITGDGVYRLVDGHKVIDTSTQEVIHSQSLLILFSSDSSLATTATGIYRLIDSQLLLAINTDGARFSPNLAYVTNGEGVYRLSDGIELLDIQGEVFFTPDNILAVAEDGIYRLSDGEQLVARNFSFSYPHYPIFSPDSLYMIVNQLILSETPTEFGGVYRLSDGERLFISSGARFSPDGAFVLLMDDGVYRLDDQRLLFELDKPLLLFPPAFSPDGAYLGTEHGIYRMVDGQKLFETYTSTFSPDGNYVAFQMDGVYRLSDRQHLFYIDGGAYEFSVESDYLIRSNYPVVYRIRDGQRFDGVRVLNVEAGILAIGSSVIIVE